MNTSVKLKADEEPNPWYKTFWCLLFLIIPVGILLLEHNVEGLNVLQTIQSMITISSLPVLKRERFMNLLMTINKINGNK